METFEPKPMKLMFIIVEKKLGKKAIKLLNENGVTYHFATGGEGTAPSDMQSYFGFGATERTVLCCPLSEEKVDGVFALLRTELHFDEPNSGIAFTVPIQSISNLTVLKFLAGML